jgi:hypothetical protein
LVYPGVCETSNKKLFPTGADSSSSLSEGGRR